MEWIAENLERVRARIHAAAARAGRSGDTVQLVAVTKTVDPERIRAALAAGVTEIGENYLQEAVTKFPQLVGLTFRSHFIGHLQRNKAGRATERFDVIQSIDSEALARTVAQHAVGARSIDVLIEVNAAGESSKAGVSPDQALALAETVGLLEGVRLKGLMGMGPLGGEEPDTRRAFRTLARLFERLPAGNRQVLSMGMTGDFETAIEEGATMVRIGTGIFGPRSQ